MGRRITVEEAKPGMVLAEPLADLEGRTLVGQGTRLSPIHISRLRKWGVSVLFVEGPEEAVGGRIPQGAGRGPSADASAAAGAEGAAAGGLPPGVYAGPDLLERISGTFANVADDPVLGGLCEVVKKRLAGRLPGEDAAHGS
jgi:hypothetical protein